MSAVLQFLKPADLRKKSGAVYLLESDTLFKLGSSAEPWTRVRAQKRLYHEDGTDEAVAKIWVAPMIEEYQRQERAFQYLVCGYGEETLRETWLKHCGFSLAGVNLDVTRAFQNVPCAALCAYFELWMRFYHLATDRDLPVEWLRSVYDMMWSSRSEKEQSTRPVFEEVMGRMCPSRQHQPLAEEAALSA